MDDEILSLRPRPEILSLLEDGTITHMILLPKTEDGPQTKTKDEGAHDAEATAFENGGAEDG